MNNFLQKIVIEPLNSFLEKVSHFLPNLLSFLLILILGIVLGIVFKSIFLRFFRRLKLDKFSEKWGLVEVLHKSGLKEPPSLVLSKFISWVTIIIFVLVSLHSLNVPTIEQLLEKLILYLPNAIVAVIIVFVGYVLGNFISRAVLVATVNAGWRMSGVIAKFTKLTVFLIAVSMSLEQLGIGKKTVVIAFSIVFGGVIFALALAIGLGGKDIAKDYLGKNLKGKEEKEDEISHL
jgi:hypothetical protein